MAIIKLNIGLSMLINLVAVILAATGVMGPVVGALVHNGGAFLIALNAASLLGFKSKPAPSARSVAPSVPVTARAAGGAKG